MQYRPTIPGISRLKRQLFGKVSLYPADLLPVTKWISNKIKEMLAYANTARQSQSHRKV